MSPRLFGMRMKMMCRLAGLVAAAALLAATGAQARAQTARPKPHSKTATTHSTTTHKKTAAKAGAKKPAARTTAAAAKRPAARPAAETAHVSQATVDEVHAWEAQKQRAQGGVDGTPAGTAGGKTAARPSAGAKPSVTTRPAAGRSGSESEGRSATAADFDKAAAAKRRTAKPDPETPMTPEGTPKSEAVPGAESRSGGVARSADAGAGWKAAALPQARLVYVRGRLVVPAPLVGSHEVLVHQNEVADSEGLNRIQDDADLEAMRAKKLLVALPVGHGLQVDPRLPMNRRYTRPWAAKFLSDLARAHAAKFGRALQVNSAVRTVDFQERLAEYNGNAAGVDGDTASPHLTGQAVDIAKKGLSKTEIAWMRAYLAPLIAAGKIDVEEEFQQACFHVSVYRRYVPETAAPRKMPASAKRPVAHPAAVVAAAVR